MKAICCRLRWSKPTHLEVNFKELVNKIQHPPFLCVFYRGTTGTKCKIHHCIKLYGNTCMLSIQSDTHILKAHTCLRHTLWSTPSTTLLPSPVAPQPCLFLFSEPAHLPTCHMKSHKSKITFMEEKNYKYM